MKNRNPMPGFHAIRRDQLREESIHDSYEQQRKPAEPAVCPACGAVFHDGRWQWTAAPEGATPYTCPACHRIQDRLPAGFLHLSGPFFAAHRDEIQQLLHHREASEKAEHPMARIMGIEEETEGAVFLTTDLHLARNLGDAVHSAYRGNLDFHYNKAENLLRVFWER